MDNWKPIEELPEYMLGVLVWDPETECVYCAYYYFYAGSRDEERKPIWAYFDSDGAIKKIKHKLTHWMPVPEPPK